MNNKTKANTKMNDKTKANTKMKNKTKAKTKMNNTAIRVDFCQWQTCFLECKAKDRKHGCATVPTKAEGHIWAMWLN